MEGLSYFDLALADLRDPLFPLWVMELLADVFFYGWLFAFGATVGSFLNVVIYRLPRGKNLAFPGSCCPRCDTPIRLSDNIPIVSWLALQGRCRHCQAGISSRYFVVELLVAVMFLVVLVGEYFLPTFGISAPTRRPLTTYDGIPFWVMYAVHVSLITTLIGAVLIAADGFRVPTRLFAPVMFVALAAGIIWPQIRSVAAVEYGALPAWQVGLIDGLIGTLAGTGVAAIFELAASRFRKPRSSIALFALSASLGIVLGWQRVLWVAPVVLFTAEWVARGLRIMAERRAEAAANAAPAEPPVELPLEATPPPTPESIQEEIHIAAAPTEPTETS
jgi:leader peptidase (prepilin peptidase) / N-methyltransferase